MKIDKQQILDLIKTRGETGDPQKADQAEQDLPNKVDTDKPEHQNLLQKFGVDPAALLKKFASKKFGL